MKNSKGYPETGGRIPRRSTLRADVLIARRDALAAFVGGVVEEPTFRDSREAGAFLKADDGGGGALPRMIVYHVACAVGRDAWTADLRSFDLAAVAGAPAPPPPAPLVDAAAPLFQLDADDAPGAVRDALDALETHAAAAAALVRDAALRAAADPDAEARAAVALRAFAAPRRAAP